MNIVISLGFIETLELIKMHSFINVSVRILTVSSKVQVTRVVSINIQLVGPLGEPAEQSPQIGISVTTNIPISHHK